MGATTPPLVGGVVSTGTRSGPGKSSQVTVPYRRNPAYLAVDAASTAEQVVPGVSKAFAETPPSTEGYEVPVAAAQATFGAPVASVDATVGEAVASVCIMKGVVVCVCAMCLIRRTTCG